MTHHIVVGLRHPRPVPSVPADLEVELPALLLHLDVGLVVVLGVEHAVALGRVDGAPAQHSQWPSFTMCPGCNSPRLRAHGVRVHVEDVGLAAVPVAAVPVAIATSKRFIKILFMQEENISYT